MNVKNVSRFVANKIAISGASGKTGFRIAEEAKKSGKQVRLLIRETSIVPNTLSDCEKAYFSIASDKSLDQALEGCDALVIATGARPSIDLTGPARIDAVGVSKQIESCKRVGINRILLVSSLCAGRFFHPLNLFGLILIWKRLGEQSLEESGLEWTIIRPGGLTEQEDNLNKLGICYTGPDKQEEAYIPRRLVAKCCIEALKTPTSINQIIEITSDEKQKTISMEQAITDIMTFSS